ncbi:MAG: zinc metallopeptidase [Gemmatimonadaceae bacterium]|nr:zinc metallopeptidase [Gemmatimonadaceae bacterium]
MRWTPGGNRGNLEDRRGMGGLGKGLGIGGTVVVLALSLLTGRNLFQDLGVEPGVGGAAAPMTAADSARQEQQVDFVVDVLNDAQNTWQKTFAQNNQNYSPAKLVLFRNSTQSACGIGQSAMGPFYCPLDQKVYIDLAFYDELSKRFGAKGDFAQAYVLAHELGHHVQHQLGTDSQVRSKQESNPDAANELSVRLELQADCYAGVWGHDAASRGKLEAGDVEEALGAASAVGDDRIQQQTQGRVNVDAFTHGSAAQRAEWYKRGMESGDVRSCDTLQ